MACSDQISTQDLINAKDDAITLGEVATSRAGAASSGTPIAQSTNRFGETTDTIQGRLNKLGVLYDDPIKDWSASLLVSDLRAHRYPAGTGDIYIPTKPLPFTTGGSFNSDDWVILQGLSSQDLINDLSQAYDFETLDDAVNSTINFPVGKVLHIKERSTGNGGGATWGAVLASSVTPNGYDVVQCTGVPTFALVLRVGAELDFRQIGVVGNGVVDDTGALNAALKYRNVIGADGLSIRTTATIFIENELDFNLAGATILGETIIDGEPWFWFRSDNINMYGGTFGDGTVGGKPIIIGDDYGSPVNLYRNFNIHDNLFNIGDISTAKGFISGVGRVFELSVFRNRFQSSAVLSGKNVAAVFMQNDGAVIDNTTQLSWKIENNVSVGIPYLFNNFSGGFAANILISGNTIRDADAGLRTYHLYECIVSNNTFVNCSETIYIWQRSDFTDNIIQDCGDGNYALKFETPTSTIISGNDVRNSNGAGVLLDGGNADFTFQDNAIWQSSASGLVIDPNNAFGGQNIGTVIQGNRITQNFTHGIDVIVSAALRVMTIKDNYISGNGLDNPIQVAAIHFDTTANAEINELTIVNNVLRNNDIVGGISTANTQWAIQYEGGTAFSSTSITANNMIYTPEVISESKVGGGGSTAIVNNFVPNIVDPQVIGVSWFSNYNAIQQATGHRRTSNAVIGVLTPNFLGEECFSVNEQNWYKSVGSSTGPWTSADWKLIT